MDLYYFKTSNSSFVLTDNRILEEYFSVHTYHIKNKNGPQYILALLKLIIFLIIKGKKARIYFIRFADWHTALIAFFKKLYGRKLVIVVGGFDAFHIPQYGYGVYHSWFRGWCAKYALRNATVILPNSPCLIDYTNTYASEKPIRGGIRYFEPRIKNNIKVVYNGFDTSLWSVDAHQVKNRMVLTVAIVNNMKTYHLKGIDSFIDLARIMPETKFMIVGLNRDFISQQKINIPSNLNIIELVKHHELQAYYAAAKVFCLLSLSEGMPNVLCEAMLCQCIPVGSNVTLIPEIIGDAGFIVNHKKLEEMKEKVEKALSSDVQLGKKARQRIIDNYSIQSRKKELRDIVQNMLS